MVRIAALVLVLMTAGPDITFAQKAGSGADQIASLGEKIDGLHTEGEIFGLPVNFHGQTTYINQRYGAFNSPYQGMNSLSPDRSMSYTWSGTLFFGVRLGPHTDVYLNPELVSGVPFSGLVGLGGFTNGEATRAQGATPHLYSARAFVRHTINQGGGEEVLDNDANQISQTVTRNRIVITAGQFATLDIFDDSRYAKDPRVQMMNWGSMTHLAYDYAADARGYGWGLAAEWYLDNWTFRASQMTTPKQPNGFAIDPDLLKHYGSQIEAERRHQIADLPGKVSVLAYRNRMIMARYTDATAYVIANHAQGTQAITKVRNAEQIKTGVGINAEQAFTKDAGVYIRAFASDGHTETMSFAEADRSLSIGMGMSGERWGRPRDTIGAAALINGLSADRKAYLQAGGISDFVGDYFSPTQTISYKPEQIAEFYFNALATRNILIGINFQHVINPAYNSARGPVNVMSFRVHAEF